MFWDGVQANGPNLPKDPTETIRGIVFQFSSNKRLISVKILNESRLL